MRQNAMHEDHLTSKKMELARTFQVFYTRGTPGMSFKKGETMHLLTEKATVLHS